MSVVTKLALSDNLLRDDYHILKCEKCQVCWLEYFCNSLHISIVYIVFSTQLVQYSTGLNVFQYSILYFRFHLFSYTIVVICD